MTLAGKPVSHYRPRRREFAWAPLMRRLPEKPPLFEWVLLSMLIHALAIVLFGAPAGGSSEGRAMWGSLQVVLMGSKPEASPQLKLDRGTIEGLKAPAAMPEHPAPPVRAPAQPAKPSLRAAPRIEQAAPPVESPPPPQAAPKVEPIAIPPVLERIIVPERQFEVPAFTVPPPTQNQTPSPVPAPAAPAPPPAAPPKEAPVAREAPAPKEVAPPVPPAPRLPQVERAPAEVPKLSVPLMQPIAPSVMPERVESPPQLEIPRIESPVVPAVPAPPVITQPLETNAIPAPAIPSLAPVPQIETIARPVEKPPVEQVPVTPPPVTVPAPATPAPAAAPQVQPRIEPRVEPSTEPAAAPQREAAPAIEKAPPPESPFRAAPAPALGLPGAPSGSRKQGEEPSSDYDPFSSNQLDLDAMRRRAAQLARGSGNSALLPFPMPAVPPRKSKMEEAIENARKPDCRTAYAQLGLAAIVPLVANEFGEGTCRW